MQASAASSPRPSPSLLFKNFPALQPHTAEYDTPEGGKSEGVFLPLFWCLRNIWQPVRLVPSYRDKTLHLACGCIKFMSGSSNSVLHAQISVVAFNCRRAWESSTLSQTKPPERWQFENYRPSLIGMENRKGNDIKSCELASLREAEKRMTNTF